MSAIFLRQLCNSKISAILAFEILLKDSQKIIGKNLQSF